MSADHGYFFVCVEEEINGELFIRYHRFVFKAENAPEKEMDFTAMDLQLQPDDDNYDPDKPFREYDFVSGSAKVVSVDKDDSRITVVFDNLLMKDGEDTYTFDGEAMPAFEYFQGQI